MQVENSAMWEEFYWDKAFLSEENHAVTVCDSLSQTIKTYRMHTYTQSHIRDIQIKKIMLRTLQVREFKR